MNYLQAATKNWSNLEYILVNKFEACNYASTNCTEKQMGKTYQTYARMASRNELFEVGCSIDDMLGEKNCPSWITENFILNGFWTNSSSNEGVFSSYIMLYDGVLWYDALVNGYMTNYGVRPVITLDI